MRTLSLVIASLLCCAALFGAEQAAQTPEQAREQLAAAQRAIDDVQAWLARANDQQSAEEKRLQDAAIALSDSSRELKELATQRQRLEGELADLERLIAEDAAKLLTTLKGPQYDLANTGIVSVIPGEPVTEPLLDPTSEITALVLSLPFDLLYLEASA